jgi:hypothetical protein
MNLVFSSVNKIKAKSSLYSTTPIIESSQREPDKIQNPFQINKTIYKDNILFNMIGRIQYDNSNCAKCGMK